MKKFLVSMAVAALAIPALAQSSAPARVAVIASGGLSHFVVDEELDRQILKRLEQKDAGTLTSLP